MFSAASTSKDGEEKSLPDVKTNPTPPAFTCTPYQTHILCNCCMQPMPDRRHLANIPGNNVPPIQCEYCSCASQVQHILRLPFSSQLSSQHYNVCLNAIVSWYCSFDIINIIPGAVCSRSFCHAYWGCLKGDCMGCIGKFGGRCALFIEMMVCSHWQRPSATSRTCIELFTMTDLCTDNRNVQGCCRSLNLVSVSEP